MVTRCNKRRNGYNATLMNQKPPSEYAKKSLTPPEIPPSQKYPKGYSRVGIFKQDKCAWLAQHNIARQRRSREISGVFGAILRDFKIVPVSFALSSLKLACYAVLEAEFQINNGKEEEICQKKCQREASECPMNNGKLVWK